ncbi:MAG: acyl-CoA thioesterase [Mariniblastus sp.]|nr:acyl-CoA thioesterase [Mariniblastus sp.]
MSQVFKTIRRVQFRDTDAAGIVHFSVFFTYMEQAEHEFLLSVGLGVINEQDGQTISFPRVHAECDYRSPIRFEELVEIEMVVQKIGSRSVTYQFKFSCEGRDVADGLITVACCEFSTGSPVPVAVPDRFLHPLQDYLLDPQD